jgi:hypothetical protein
MLGIFMVFVAFTRRSAIDATAVVARWFIWNKNFKSDVRLVWNVVCSFADERPMNLLLRTKILTIAPVLQFLSRKLPSSNSWCFD